MESLDTLGQGLIEISAIATLIGGPVAEALIHGQKGAGGLAWAPTSSFGSIHVIKACLAEALPDGVRESVGMRGPAVDDAIGLHFPVRRGHRAKDRVELGDAVALLIDRTRLIRLAKAKSKSSVIQGIGPAIQTVAMTTYEQKGAAIDRTVTEVEEDRIDPYDGGWVEAAAGDIGDISAVYVLDRKTRLTLSTVEGAEDGKEILIHIFHPDLDAPSTVIWDWSAMALSLVKLAEVIWLKEWGSQYLWILTMIPWIHSLLSAIIFQLSGLSRDDSTLRSVDVAAGTLPTPQRLHKGGKIVIGLPPNVCRNTFRRLIVGIGAIINVSMLLVSFILLGREESRIAYLWISFQGAWLLVRTLVYHWRQADSNIRRRVFGVLTGTANHQNSIHPRGPYLYVSDCPSFERLAAYAAQSRRRVAEGLSNEWLQDQKVLDIVTATGDTYMRSVAWFRGIRSGNLDLYDACLFFLRIGDEIEAHCGVRCCACDCSTEIVRDGRKIRQRGTTCDMYCETMAWRLFIPIQRGDARCWVYIRTSNLVGKCQFEILDEDILHGMLQAHRWRISLTHIDHMRKAYAASQEASNMILDFVLEEHKD